MNYRGIDPDKLRRYTAEKTALFSRNFYLPVTESRGLALAETFDFNVLPERARRHTCKEMFHQVMR